MTAVDAGSRSRHPSRADDDLSPLRGLLYGLGLASMFWLPVVGMLAWAVTR